MESYSVQMIGTHLNDWLSLKAESYSNEFVIFVEKVTINEIQFKMG